MSSNFVIWKKWRERKVFENRSSGSIGFKTLLLTSLWSLCKSHSLRSEQGWLRKFFVWLNFDISSGNLLRHPKAKWFLRRPRTLYSKTRRKFNSEAWESSTLLNQSKKNVKFCNVNFQKSFSILPSFHMGGRVVRFEVFDSVATKMPNILKIQNFRKPGQHNSYGSPTLSPSLHLISLFIQPSSLQTFHYFFQIYERDNSHSAFSQCDIFSDVVNCGALFPHNNNKMFISSSSIFATYWFEYNVSVFSCELNRNVLTERCWVH